MTKRFLIFLGLMSLAISASAGGFDFNFHYGESENGWKNLQSGMEWTGYTPTPGTYAFGSYSTGKTVDKVFTLNNPGNDVLEAATLTVAGTDFSLNSTTCGTNPFNLALLSTCTATVRFTAATGDSTGTLTASAPNLTDQVIDLTGTGVSAVACGTGGACPTTVASYTGTVNDWDPIGDTDAHFYQGQKIQSVANNTIGHVEYKIYDIAGNVSAIQYHVAVYPTTGGNLGTAKIISPAFAGSTLSVGGVVAVDLGGTVTLAQNDVIVLYREGNSDAANYVYLNSFDGNVDSPATYSEFVTCTKAGVCTVNSVKDSYYLLKGP